MNAVKIWGAGRERWQEVERAGLTALALPVVSNPNALPSKGSKMKAFGKTPSRYNARGEAMGFRAWPSHTTTADELNAWAGNPDYGICLRTGHGVIAFDCDISNAETAARALAILREHLGDDAPVRRRSDSEHFLMPVRCDAARSKEVLHLAGTDMIEVLANGQQFVAFGTHPAGRRYEWTAGLEAMPALDADALQALIDDLRTGLGADSDGAGQAPNARRLGKTELKEDRLAEWLRDSGRVIAEDRPGELQITCPWESEHTGGEAGDTSTTYFQAGTNGHPEGAFVCLHAHCRSKTTADFIAWAETQGYKPVQPGDFKALKNPPAKKPTPACDLRNYTNEKTGKVEACIGSVEAAVKAGAAFIKYEVRYDTFRACRVMRAPEKAWHRMEDVDGFELRRILEDENKFKRIPAEVFRAGLELAAYKLRFDSMLDIMAELPAWDGTPRVERFYSTYCGAKDNDYSRALGRYTFTALAGRSLSVNGIKADIMPVFVGKQGIRKSTLVRALALSDEFSADISLADKPDDIARKLAGMQTVEIPELAGLKKIDMESLKRLLTLDRDTYVPKYMEERKDIPRRCVIFSTTNEMQFLQDTSGNRRFAPIELTEIDIDAVRRDLAQLYAEGVVLFKANGIEHRALEKLSAEENDKYLIRDPWEARTLEWLEEEREQSDDLKQIPLTTENLLRLAVGVGDTSRMDKRASNRMAVIMRGLGWRQTRRWVNKRHIRVWVQTDFPDKGDDIPF